MICKTCRMAASFVNEAEVIVQHLDGRPQEMLTGAEAARSMHGKCEEHARRRSGLNAVELAGSSRCDCQHYVPIPAGGAPPTLD
jgi:hypothetical protein